MLRPIASFAISLASVVLMSCGDKTTSKSEEFSKSSETLLYPGATYVLQLKSGKAWFAETNAGGVDITNDDRLIYKAGLENMRATVELREAEYLPVIDEKTFVVEMPPVTELIIETMEHDGSGILHYGEITITTEWSDSNGAQVSFSNDATGRSLVSTFDNSMAALELNGQSIDGLGHLSKQEAQALQEISTGGFAAAVTMAGLDLGCHKEAESIPPQIHAALLFPWQLILKYQLTDRSSVIKHFVQLSACGFVDAPVNGGDKPLNESVFWNRDHIIPSTAFYLPLDGEGQMEVMP